MRESLRLRLETLTDVDKAAGRSLAEHLGFVGERHLHHARDVSGRGLHPDGVAGDQLAPDQHGAEDHLEAVEEVVADDDDGAAPGGPALAGRDGLDAGDGGRGVEAGVER